MFRVKRYNKKKKIGLPIILVSALLIFISVFGFTLSQYFTSFIEADVNGAIRGQPNDLWADIVLGKRSFGEISPREVVADKVSSPGGVIVDRSVSPGRAYIWDSGNSRILGINLADCYATDSEERCTGDIVIGQPSLNDYGACNQDASFQYYPEATPASASTICGIPEWTHTTLEHKTFTSMFVDSNGDLYIADVVNNRVLKYISPFTTDQIADDVWGQPDFTGTDCNLTGGWGDETPAPTDSSLCFSSTYSGGAGVSLDDDGNLWVADGGNYRVLRFPNNSGTIAKTADIVIGQESFTTIESNDTADRLRSPTSIRFASNGDMYIADTGNTRVQLFKAPFTTGMNAFETVLDSDTLTGGLVSIEMFPDGNGFWTYEGEDAGAGFRDWDLDGAWLGHHFTNWNPGGGSIGIDTEGNILVSAYVYQQDVARFAYDSNDDIYTADKSFFYPPGGYNLTTARRLEQGGWGGLAVNNNQLIVADGRLLYWNDPLNKTSGVAPDGYVGAASATDKPDPGYSIMKSDLDGKVYVVKGTQIYVYQAPLNNSSTPITILTPSFNAKGGGSVSILNTIGGIAVAPHSEYLWVSNPDNNRVFRIHDPLDNPVVDIVLGQTSLSGVECNKGIVAPPNIDGNVTADRSMLCIPGALSLDNNENLFVSDHFFEAAGNWRLLMFGDDLFPANPDNIIFNLSATKEFPRVNNITQFGAATFETAFDSTNRMVVGYNPYFGPRFLEYFNNPTTVNLSNRSDPVYAVADGRFKDFGGWVFSLTFDSNDNLFAYDTNRGQVLIYKDPFGTPDSGGGDNGGGDNVSGNNGGNGGNNNNGGNNSTGNGGNNTGNLGNNNNAITTGNNVSSNNKPVSYIPVKEQYPVSFANNDTKTTVNNGNPEQAIDELVNNTESEKTLSLVMSVLVEFAKSSNPNYPLNFAAVLLFLILLLLGIYLAFSKGNILGVIPLLTDSLLNRNKNYGGVIYNSTTLKPISFAKVSILRKSVMANNVAADQIETYLTDLEGRYKLLSLPSRNLTIEVKALGYEYFLKPLPGNLDIALDPTKEVTTARRLFAFNTNSLIKWSRIAYVLAAIWGYIVTIYEQVAQPSTQNVILLAIYSVLFIIVSYPSLYSLFLKKVTVMGNDSKLAGAVVRIYKDRKLIDMDLTDKKGVAKFGIEEGIYTAIATKPGFGVEESELEIGEENKIKAQLNLKPSTQSENLTSNLDLHDQVIQENHNKFNLH